MNYIVNSIKLIFKKYTVEVLAFVFLLISYLLTRGFFFSIDGAGFVENFSMKSVMKSIYADREFKGIRDIKYLYMPALSIAVIFYSFFGKSRRKFLILTFGYLAFFLVNPILEYNFISNVFFGDGVSFTYFRYFLLIISCVASAHFLNKIYCNKNLDSSL